MTQTDARPPERVLSARGVAVRDARRHVLEPTTLELRTGHLVVATGDPGHGHTLLALALAGRLAGGEGEVTLDGSPARRLLQESVALVDVPGVTEPDGSVPLATIAGEELAMAGRPARRQAVLEWMRANRLGEHVDARVDELPAAVRTSALCRLAALRPGVDFVVLVLPERLGDVSDSWVATARELVAADFGVLVTVSLGTARGLTTYDDLTVVPLGGAPDSSEETA
jgi:energy-coupling factor transporter ATP-binding protein EcfA2